MGEREREVGRVLQGSAYGSDDGRPDPTLRRALRDHHDDPASGDRRAAALAALATSRLLVPVVAVLGEADEVERADGTPLRVDKTSDMAVVLLTRADGRRALLAFSGTDTLQAWDPAARPVPVGAALAAATAVQEGAGALVVDLAGPGSLVVDAAELAHLAAGLRPARVGEGWAWIGQARE